MNVADIHTVVKFSMTPSVLVLVNESVEMACLHSTGVSLHELLLQRAVSLDTSSSDCKVNHLRFVTEEQVRGLPTCVRESILLRAISPAVFDSYSNFSLCHPSQVVDFLKMYPSPTPWFAHFQWLYTQLVGCCPYGTLDHPSACIVVASADSDSLPVIELGRLWPPGGHSLFREKPFMDNAIPIFYLLVQFQDTPVKKVEAMLKDVHSTFGSRNCGLLKLKSFYDCPTPAPPQIPFSTVSGLSPPTPLSEDEKQQIDRVINSVAGLVSAYISRTIESLVSQMQSSRKSVGGKIKNILRRETSSSGVGYIAPQTPLPSNCRTFEEATLRHADCCILTGDIESAAKSYALIEQRNDKFSPYHAYAREMMALISLFTDGRDCDSGFEQAFKEYCSSNEYHLATRVIMMHAWCHKLRGNFKSASERYYSITDQPPSPKRDDLGQLVKAFLLEQGAFCHLHGSPPMLRKFGFRLTSAGAIFGSMGQGSHALRCYLLTRGSCSIDTPPQLLATMDQQRCWWVASGQSLQTLVEYTYLHGRLDEAFRFAEILLKECTRQPFQIQSSILRQYIFICKKKGFRSAVPISLPCIQPGSLQVALNDDYPSCSDCVLPVQKGSKTAVSLESFHIEADLHNPLLLSLQLQQIHVFAEDSHNEVVSNSVDLVLPPGENHRVEFDITPILDGEFTLKGLRFLLSGVVWGQLEMTRILCTSNSRRLVSSPREMERPPEGLVFAPLPPSGLPLDFTPVSVDVSLPSALLVLNTSSMPNVLLEGECCLYSFCVMNGSRVAANSLSLAFSHTAFFVPVTEADYQLHQQQCTAKTVRAEESPKPQVPKPVIVRPRKASNPTQSAVADAEKASASATTPHEPDIPTTVSFASAGVTDSGSGTTWFPVSGTSQPHSRMLIPFWIRPKQTAGLQHFTMHIVLRYFSDSNPTKPRFTHKHVQVIIVPTLKLTPFLHSSPSDCYSNTLHLQVENLHQSVSITLRQISCLSSYTLLPNPLVASADPLPPQSSRSLFYKMNSPWRDGAQDKSVTSHTYSDITEHKHIDTTQSPYSDYVNAERKPYVPRFGQADFVVHWEANTQQTHVGYHVAPAVQLEKFATDVSAEKRIGELSIHFPAVPPVTHDFARHRFCEVAVELHVKSCSSMPIAVTVEATRPPNRSYLWSGFTNETKKLKFHQHMVVKAIACVSHAGDFDLSSFKISYLGTSSAYFMSPPTAPAPAPAPEEVHQQSKPKPQAPQPQPQPQSQPQSTFPQSPTPSSPTQLGGGAASSPQAHSSPSPSSSTTASSQPISSNSPSLSAVSSTNSPSVKPRKPQHPTAPPPTPPGQFDLHNLVHNVVSVYTI
ncbi:trafficking protein particle complex subunit 8 [Pelomyxa schiedti]|nr:trafficking protein particle complex subunit 8 [Pelomyxa schiedti]